MFIKYNNLNIITYMYFKYRITVRNLFNFKFRITIIIRITIYLFFIIWVHTFTV